MEQDELTKHFGPKRCAKPLPKRKTRDELLASAIRGGSKWKGEPGVVALLEAFETVVEPPRSQWMRKQWYAGARDFLEEHGEDCELLVDTARHLMGRGMCVTTPRACIKTAFSLKQKMHNSEEYRRSYLEGEL